MNRTIFITGGTGALGADLLPKLLCHYRDHDIVAIVRGKNQIYAANRLFDIIGVSAGKLNVIVGDVAEGKFGLSDDVYRNLIDNTDKIFHLAANVRFNSSLAEARKGNVQTTARRCRHKIFAHNAMHRICTAATKEAVFLA
jgi:thioester reductase-like protein